MRFAKAFENLIKVRIFTRSSCFWRSPEQVSRTPPWPRLGVAITGVGKRGRGTGA